MWLPGPLNWEPRRWHKAYGKLEASSKGSYQNNWVNSAAQCYIRQAKAHGVLLERCLTLHAHTTSACTHKCAPKPSTESSFPLVIVVKVLLKYKWAISQSQTENPDRNVTSLIHYLPNPQKNFYIKISLYHLRGMACLFQHALPQHHFQTKAGLPPILTPIIFC